MGQRSLTLVCGTDELLANYTSRTRWRDPVPQFTPRVLQVLAWPRPAGRRGTRVGTQPAPHVLFHLGSLPGPLPSKILAAGMKGRGRERRLSGCPLGWTGELRGNGPAAGPNGTDYNPHSAPRQWRDPTWLPAWRQTRGPIGEEHELRPCQSEAKGQ